MAIDYIVKGLARSLYEIRKEQLQQPISSREFNLARGWMYGSAEEFMSYKSICKVLGLNPKVLSKEIEDFLAHVDYIAEVNDDED